MPFDQLCGQFDTLLCRNIWKPNEPRVWNTMQVNERAEIRVDGDKNSVFGY